MPRDAYLDNLLRGLSDFWIRFFADIDELDAYFEATENQLAQAYLEILSSFLGISVSDVPLFSTKYFQLIRIREDQLRYRTATNPSDVRHVFTFTDKVVALPSLQNKVYAPTAGLVPTTDYDVDAEAYTVAFITDVAGTVGQILGAATDGNLLTYGTGALTRCYTTAIDSLPFTKAKAGHWVRITNSIAGNNHTYAIDSVIDAQTVLLIGSITLPEPNSGSLGLELLDSDYSPLPSYGRRYIAAEMGGSFDDTVLRSATEQQSWGAPAPIGLGVQKGDILRILDLPAVPTVPGDYEIDLVKHDRLYLATETPAPTNNSPSLTDTGRTCTFAADDYVTLTTHGFSNRARILFTTTGTLPTVVGEALSPTVFYYVRDAEPNKFKIARSPGGVAIDITGTGIGVHTCYAVGDSTETKLVRDYAILRIPEEPVIKNEQLLFTAIGVEFVATLAHTRIDRGSLQLLVGINDLVRGYRLPVENFDYRVNYETGEIIQLDLWGMKGKWSLSPAGIPTRAFYSWKEEVFAPVTHALAALRTTETEAFVNEIAFWAPNIQIDELVLANNFGYLINREQVSSEAYRSFIRGIFQLYILGPAVARIEAALNVICGMPVIRDDGETMLEYDATSDPDHLIVKTTRPSGATATYIFPVGTPLRTDITSYIDGTSDAVTFEAFETLTTLFTVDDYTNNPSWWEYITIPVELMPNEDTGRRTSTPELFDNIVGQVDEPHVGDPGLYVGADDEGIVPDWPLPVTPPPRPPLVEIAKRRKMAHVVLDKYLKQNMFFVQFDTALASLFDQDFLTDLRELILTAKPSYIYCYVELSTSFKDTMTLTDDLDVGAYIDQPPDRFPPGRQLLVGDYWTVGTVYRYGTSQINQPLLVAPGGAPPAPVDLPYTNVITARISGPAVVKERVDYTIEYARVGGARVTPSTNWPAGTYTISYEYVVISPIGSKDPTLGDMEYVVGSADLHPENLGWVYEANVDTPIMGELPVQIKQIPV